MANNHAHHGHDVASARRVQAALAIISAFVVGEIASALWSHSLVLVADAAHLLTDVFALGVAAWAIHLGRQPAHGRWTYGLRRAEILSAAVNGVTLLIVAIGVGVTAIVRLVHPGHVEATVVLVTALVGGTVNLVVARVLAGAQRGNLNLRGAYAHVVTDLYAFIATAAAAVVILVAHWQRSDAVASLVVVVILLRASWGLLRDSGRVLLQGSPDNLDLDDVRTHLAAIDHVLSVHDLHAWTLTSDAATLSAHVVVEERCFESGHAPRILDELQSCLLTHFALEHATLQLEPPTHSTHEDGLHH